MNPPPAEIGASVADIDTPALIVDLDALDRNIAKMAEFARSTGVRVRPHAKTHKSAAIALRQIAHGAVGQCVQKVGEAEALVRGGVKDILVSNQVVGDRKLRRLAALAQDATIALCFDSAEQVDAASRVAQDFGVELGALVEIDVGMERCGVAPGKDAAALARRIADAPGLKFRGLQAYHGRAQHLPTHQQRAQAIASAVDAVRETLDALQADNLDLRDRGRRRHRHLRVRGGERRLQRAAGRLIRVHGHRLRQDRQQGRRALHRVRAQPVRARLGDQHADGGSRDRRCGPEVLQRRERPALGARAEDVELTNISDEHGKLMLGPKAKRLKLGEKVWLIPGHCDPTVNLHDWYVGVRNGRVEALWPVSARGAST